MTAGNPGEHDFEGELYYKQGGQDKTVKVNDGFKTIAMPNSAVISADKMNVVYRAVDNPITISVPGVSDDQVKATAPGLRRVKGNKYNMKPGTGNKVTIRASFTLPDGTTKSSTNEFRIKVFQNQMLQSVVEQVKLKLQGTT